MVKTSYLRATEKTRRKIRKAFANLLVTRGSVKNITVTDLAERAEITRGTFIIITITCMRLAPSFRLRLRKSFLLSAMSLILLAMLSNM